ncbi:MULTISPECIES: diaminopimelate decarboxylase [unclassified Ectothiorhodospira]|uniref:diaminopimelate decarboxylase n=1 Tax=unclassified Ectothiorhodospira TaxID=2684909 RepID=UPI001EE85883|nr:MULTISPECIES: diaminopimelate decarboxylase [unclassified Ectothiorhodospira]MCG5515518.1 diaminopimelate decarboxylase [Ectothiorhodospira sp. 9100]MCG5518486.1 diaminopimelate decarboxylase [Ectothiorhodospira sp. 9905]
MDHFNYQDGVLCAEDVSLQALAEAHGTPLYVYSRATLERHWKAFDDALGDHPHLVCYAVKANSSLAVLNVLARLGAGFDIVSGGELERVLRAGGDPKRVVFSGVGKQVGEMRRALEMGIRCFNVESVAELERLNREAGGLGMIAPVSIRVNPDVDAGTHPYISTGLKENKFGVDVEDALDLYRQAAALPHLRVTGLDCHIGSQLTSLDPFVDALRRVLLLTRALEGEGIHLDHLDLGGGLGIRYQDETPPSPRDYAQAMLAELKDTDYEILLEPGRAIAGNAGVLLTRVEYLKPTRHKDFAIVDAAMNDLIRPALYDAWMDILPVRPRGGESREYDVVGPVCETGDFLGKGRSLVLEEGDLLVVRSAGAYGYVMSSNYNTRARAAEVMVEGDRAHVITRRETLEDLLARETVLPA